jgi:hypothetical protein
VGAAEVSGLGTKKAAAMGSTRIKMNRQSITLRVRPDTAGATEMLLAVRLRDSGGDRRSQAEHVHHKNEDRHGEH